MWSERAALAAAALGAFLTAAGAAAQTPETAASPSPAPAAPTAPAPLQNVAPTPAPSPTPAAPEPEPSPTGNCSADSTCITAGQSERSDGSAVPRIRRPHLRRHAHPDGPARHLPDGEAGQLRPTRGGGRQRGVHARRGAALRRSSTCSRHQPRHSRTRSATFRRASSSKAKRIERIGPSNTASGREVHLLHAAQPGGASPPAGPPWRSTTR